MWGRGASRKKTPLVDGDVTVGRWKCDEMTNLVNVKSACIVAASFPCQWTLARESSFCFPITLFNGIVILSFDSPQFLTREARWDAKSTRRFPLKRSESPADWTNVAIVLPLELGEVGLDPAHTRRCCLDGCFSRLLLNERKG